MLIKLNFDIFEYLINIEIHVCHSILNKTLCSTIISVLHLFAALFPLSCNHEVKPKYVYFRKRCVILYKSWRWQNTDVSWLSCRNGMRDPVVVGLHVWRGEDGRGVETRELWQGRQLSQHQSSRLAVFWCEFPQTVSKSITLSFNINTYLIAWQDQTTFFKLAKEAFKFDFESEEEFTFCASPPFNTLNLKTLCWKWRQPSSGSRRKRNQAHTQCSAALGTWTLSARSGVHCSVHSKSWALKCTQHSVHSKQWALSTQCHSPIRH